MGDGRWAPRHCPLAFWILDVVSVVSGLLGDRFASALDAPCSVSLCSAPLPRTVPTRVSLCSAPLRRTVPARTLSDATSSSAPLQHTVPAPCPTLHHLLLRSTSDARSHLVCLVPWLGLGCWSWGLVLSLGFGCRVVVAGSGCRVVVAQSAQLRLAGCSVVSLCFPVLPHATLSTAAVTPCARHAARCYLVFCSAPVLGVADWLRDAT